MLVKTYSATLQGLEASRIEIEVQSTQGKPVLLVIGLAEKAIEEAKERLVSALSECNIRLKCRKTLINLAPADLKKTGSNLELAMAIALWQLTVQKIWSQETDIFFGELALDGQLRAIRGALPLVNWAKKNGFKRVFLPIVNLPEVEVVTGIEIYPVSHLNELLNFLAGKSQLSVLISKPYKADFSKTKIDLADIIGQKVAKRCLEIAAAGGHNLLLCGVPGAGKSLLAEAMPSILPPLTEEEALELNSIYSVAGLSNGRSLLTTRPCRCPHHTISAIGLAGGGQNLLPGEISLAHHGVLFLDELPEFRRDALEILRQPLESRVITIARASGRVTYPADISLLAASNPCPCGYLGSKIRTCRCNQKTIAHYQQKLSGPILDRLDMKIFVAEVDWEQLTKKSPPPEDNSALIRLRVLKARERQIQRYRKWQLPITTNHQLSSAQIRQLVKLDLSAQSLLRQAVEKWQLSARSYFKLIKVALTIADLQEKEELVLSAEQIAESLQYRQW